MENKHLLKIWKPREEMIQSPIYFFRKFLKRGTFAKLISKFARLNLKETIIDLPMKKANVLLDSLNRFF
jgi:hypothetical protein